MVESCGLVIKHKKEILLIKPKGIPGKNFSIPKGLMESGEDYMDAAIRETYEEVGLKFKKENIILSSYNMIPYINNKVVTKKLHYFLVDISDRDKEDVISSLKLQDSEVTSANFYTKEEAINLIFWRQAIILHYFL